MTKNTHISSRPHRKMTDALVLLVAAALMTLVSCDCLKEKAIRANEDTKDNSDAKKKQNLLIGYGLLADALAKESRLDTLSFFKNLTLDSPNEAIEKIMATLSDASERRASELEKWRNRAPDVSGNPTTQSSIGNAIQSGAEERGKSEMTDRSGGFDIRFVLLQAQATRMIAVMATSIARFDENSARKKWLKDLATEYEGYRMDLIKYLDASKCPPSN